MLKNIIFIYSFFLIVSCLPFEPSKGGVTYYNFCPNKISISSDDNTLDDISLERNQHENRFFVYSNNTNEMNSTLKKRYFIGNSIKKRFHIDRYLETRYNLVACVENAKPTGDGNWIKAN